jgi:uncharacterized membrane protein YuzA (DUF378 family)
MDDSDFPAPLPHDPTGRGGRLARAATTAALILLIIGGFNWALVGLFNMDFVAALFGPLSMAARGVYIAVGFAALYALALLPRLAYDAG